MRRLVAALPFRHGIFVNQRGKTGNTPFRFQVKSAEQTNVVPRAKLPEKESGDESPHSKRRLFRDWWLGLTWYQWVVAAMAMELMIQWHVETQEERQL